MRESLERATDGRHATGWFRALTIAALVAGVVLGGLRFGEAESPTMDPGQASPDPKSTEASVLAPVGTLPDLVVDDDQRASDAPGSTLTAAPLIPVTVLDPVRTLGTDEREQ
jgi:hypothetical protein